MYGKIFSSTFTGSMLGAGPVVFAVWGYVLANAIDSTVELNPRLLSAVIGCTPEDISAAISYLASPDPLSRNPEADGRRLVKEGTYQFRVVSHHIYRSIRAEDERREYNREAQTRSRKKAKANLVGGVVAVVTGYVYYAEAGERVKIGYSANPWSRVHEMKTFAPSITLLATEKGSLELEKLRHKEFADSHVEREWFNKSPGLVAHVAALVAATDCGVNDYAATSTTSAHTEADTDTEKEAKASFAPSDKSHDASAPPIGTLPCVGKRKSWPLYQAKVDEWQQTYPGVSVLIEMRKARQWLIDNPTRQKTFSGMPRYLNAWLAKEQNSGGSNGKTGQHSTGAVGRVTSSLDGLRKAAQESGDYADGPDAGGDGGLLSAPADTGRDDGPVPQRVQGPGGGIRAG